MSEKNECCNDCIPFNERLKDFLLNKKKYRLEYRLLKYCGVSLFILLGLQGLVYFTVFRYIEGFLGKFGWWFFYLDLAVVSIGAAMWHLHSHKTKISMMPGMMIGMTFGMQTGLMIGAIVAATNGIFMGGMTGMLSGVLIGLFNGKCCGIMGALEGMMAGMMNGIMGGMIGVMFFADKILLFMPFFIAINMIIMWGLSYMVVEEISEKDQKVRKAPADFVTFFSSVVIAAAIISILILYGPRSGLAAASGIKLW